MFLQFQRGAFKTRDGVYLIKPLVERNPGLDETGSYTRRHVVTDHLATLSQPNGKSHWGLGKYLMNMLAMKLIYTSSCHQENFKRDKFTYNRVVQLQNDTINQFSIRNEIVVSTKR